MIITGVLCEYEKCGAPTDLVLALPTYHLSVCQDHLAAACERYNVTNSPVRCWHMPGRDMVAAAASGAEWRLQANPFWALWCTQCCLGRVQFTATAMRKDT